MSQVIRRTREATGGTAAAAEIAVRCAIGFVSTQALSRAVRQHPLLAMLLASGVGYMFGREWKYNGNAPEPGDD
jgi:hypothetical protein